MTGSIYYHVPCHDSLFGRSGIHRPITTTWARNSSNVASVDIEEHPNAYTVSTDLPGLGEEGVKLEVQKGVLSIAAEKKVETQTEGEDGEPVTVSRTTRSFRHSFKLPEDVDEQGIGAQMDKGVLTLNLPKKTVEEAETGPRRIAVAGASSRLKAAAPEE